MTEAMDAEGLAQYMGSAARAAEVVQDPSALGGIAGVFDRDEVLTYATELINRLRQAYPTPSGSEGPQQFFTRLMGFDPFESAGCDG